MQKILKNFIPPFRAPFNTKKALTMATCSVICCSMLHEPHESAADARCIHPLSQKRQKNLQIIRASLTRDTQAMHP